MSFPPNRKYLEIVAHYEACLERHGDTHLGVDWPNPSDAEKRHEVMLGVVESHAPSPVSLLDFGCGSSHLYDYILRHNMQHRFHYCGLDLSQKFIDLCRGKHPAVSYYCADFLVDDSAVPSC